MADLERIKATIERDADAIQHLQEAYRDDAEFAILGKQWTPDQEATRRKRKKPSLVYNRLPGFIRHIVNGVRQQEQTGRIYPTGDASRVTAEILDGAIRAIQIASDAPAARETAVECAAVGGYGWYRIVIEDVAGEKEPRVEAIRDPLTVVWDSGATRPDRLDCEHIAILVQMTRQAFKAKYGRDPVDFGEVGVMWAPSENTVTVCEYWEKVDGKVTQTVMDGKGVLEADDENAAYPGAFLPFVWVPAEEYFVEGKVLLKGIVRDAKEPQRFLNYWKSELAYQLDSRKTPPAVVGATSITGPDGNIYPEWKNDLDVAYRRINETSNFVPQFPPAPGIPTGAAAEAAQSVDDIKASIGIYDASLGARSNEQSGRAIMARAAQGDLATFHITRSLERAVRVETLILMDLVLKLYKGRKWIQIAAEDGTVTTQELGAIMKLRDGSKAPAELQEGAYGVLVKSGPSYSTRRQQMAEILPQLVQAAPLVGQVGADILVQAVDLPGGDMLGDRLRYVMEKQGMIEPKEEEPGSPEQVQRDLSEALKALEAMQSEVQQWQQAAQALQEQATGEQAKAQAQAATDLAKIQAAAAMTLEKARIEAETKRQVALIEREAQLEEARIKAATDLQIASMKEAGSTDREAIKADASVQSATITALTSPPAPAPVESEEDDLPGESDPEEGLYS